MRAAPIDSTKRLLKGPEILYEYLQKHDTDTEHPLQAKLAALAAELAMDDADVIQFGNTAYISHYFKGGSSVFMRALNVDTAQNFIDNTENYVAYVFGRGALTIVTQYSDPVITTLIKRVRSNLEAHNPNVKAKLEFSGKSGDYLATIAVKD